MRLCKALDLADEFVASADLNNQKIVLNGQLNDYKNEYKQLGISYSLTTAVSDSTTALNSLFKRIGFAIFENNAFKGLTETVPAIKQRNELKQTLEK